MRTVSIIIPSFNCRQFLEPTLQGLARQGYSSHLFEVIVSDDGSTDGVEELIARFEMQCNVRFIPNPFSRNQIGLASVKNRGIRTAQNEVIITLDADCIPPPWFIESHLIHFSGDCESILVMGLRKFVDHNPFRQASDFKDVGQLLKLPDVSSIANYGQMYDRRIPELERLREHPMPFNCFHTCNASFLKNDALEVGLFDEAFDGCWGYEDIEFGYRMWKKGVKFRYEPRALVLHQENEFHSVEERKRGKEVNFDLACQKIPGFREFRQRLGR